MAWRSEARDALYGSWRLARLDRGGLAYFGHDEPAFWRSFIAAIIIYPAFLALMAGGLSAEDWQQGDLLRIFLARTIGYVMGWTAYPLLMLPVTRFLGREPLWLFFIIVHNWSQILETTVDVGAGIVIGSGSLSDIGVLWLMQTVILAEFLYEWFIARTVLGISGLAATMVVLADFVLVTGINRIADFLR